MDPKLEIIVFAFIIFFLLLSLGWIFRTEKRLKRFFLGKKAKDLEDTILFLEERISNLEQSNEKSEKRIFILEEKIKKCIRGVETIRFNPFPEQGGNQSFAISMINDEGDGVVMSSLYSRERMSVFAKPIKKGKSEYELSEEEDKALEKSKI